MAAASRNFGEANLSAADGVVAHTEDSARATTPVATLPPLLTRRGLGHETAALKSASEGLYNTNYTLECCFQKVRFFRAALKTNVSIRANEEYPAVAWSVSFREGF